jgi:hypothetical protein
MNNTFKYLLLGILLYHTKMDFKNIYSHFGPRLNETLIVTEESFDVGRNWLDRLPHYSLTHMPAHWFAKIRALCDIYKTTHSLTNWNIANDSHHIHSRTQTFWLLSTDWLADWLQTNSFKWNVWTQILCIVMLENNLKPSIFATLSNTKGCEFSPFSLLTWQRLIIR